MATYFGWLVCDKLFPEWNIWRKFMDHEYSHALNLDSLESSHPVEVSVENSKDLNQIFDGISYSKGSCLVRFLAEYLGEELFQKGMRKYISSNAYGNTTSKNLWEVFDDKLGNVTKMMETWTKQTGYPVITVTIKGKSIMLKQNKFLRSGVRKDETKWIVPIKISNISNEQNFLLDRSEMVINGFDTDSFIVNPNRLGFYRVMYENVPFDIRDISNEIKRQVIDDSFSLAFSGYQSITIPFDFIKKVDLFTLHDDGLWETILSGLLKILKLLEPYTKEYNYTKSYITILIMPHVKKLFREIGWEDLSDETVNISNLRPVLIDFLNYMEDVDIVGEAKHLFSQSKYKYILNVIGTHCTKQEYDKLLELLDRDADPHLKNQVIDALGSTKNEVLIDFTISNVLLNKIRTQDIWNLIRSLSNNRNATNKIWTFCKNNWNDILAIYKPGSSGLTHVVKVIASGFNTREQLEDYIKFFKIRPEGTNMIINQTIENVNNKIMSSQRMVDDIKFIKMINKINE
jgi:aminopeptidase N